GVGYARAVAGSVDYLAVVRGCGLSVPATRPDLHTEPAFNRELCRQVRAAVGGAGPGVLQGSVVDADAAQQALAGGGGGPGGQTAGPALVALLRSGRPERIRPCVLGNERCRVRDDRTPLVSCWGEPTAGHETEDLPDVQEWTTRPPHGVRHVLVVGGGPAGL